MATATRRTHVVFPRRLIDEIDGLVGKRKRSRFMAEAAESRLISLRQLKALNEAAGIWKDDDHPELKDGADAWIQSMRQEGEERIQEIENHRTT